jgi:hypothetical protein
VEMASLWKEQISDSEALTSAWALSRTLQSADRTISRALKKIGFTQKKTYGYRERLELRL